MTTRKRSVPSVSGKKRKSDLMKYLDFAQTVWEESCRETHRQLGLAPIQPKRRSRK